MIHLTIKHSRAGTAALVAAAAMVLSSCSPGLKADSASAESSTAEPSAAAAESVISEGLSLTDSAPTSSPGFSSSASASAGGFDLNGGDTGDEGQSLAPPQTRPTVQYPTSAVEENQSDTDVPAAQKLPEPVISKYGLKYKIISLGRIQEIGGYVPGDPANEYFSATLLVTNTNDRQIGWFGGLNSNLDGAGIDIDAYELLNGPSRPGEAGVAPNESIAKTTALPFQIPRGQWPTTLTIRDEAGDASFDIGALRP